MEGGAISVELGAAMGGEYGVSMELDCVTGGRMCNRVGHPDVEKMTLKPVRGFHCSCFSSFLGGMHQD